MARCVGGANGNSEQWRIYYTTTTTLHKTTSAIIPLLLIIKHKMQVRNPAIKSNALQRIVVMRFVFRYFRRRKEGIWCNGVLYFGVPHRQKNQFKMYSFRFCSAQWFSCSVQIQIFIRRYARYSSLSGVYLIYATQRFGNWISWHH
jgi:hypothetical protein